MSRTKPTSSFRSRFAVLLSLLLPLTLLATTTSVAAQDGVSTFEVDPQQNPNTADPTPVWAILEANNRYYIGGQFTTVDGRTQRYVAAVRVDTGRLDTSFRPVVGGGTDPEVLTMALSPDGRDLYIGGFFREVNGVSRDRIAKIDAFTGQLDSRFNPQASAGIETLVVDSSGVYVGGRFTTIGGATSPNLAKLNPTTGQIDPSWNASTNGPVLDLELFGSNLYVGGNFSRLNGASHDNLVRLNTTNGSVNSQWRPADDPPEKVQALAISSNGANIFAGTAGSLNNGNNGNSVWAYSNTGARQWQRALGGDVQALETSGSTLFLGTHGQFIFDETQFRLDGRTLNPSFPANGYNESPSNPNATRREKLMSLNQSNGALLPWNPELNSFNGVWELESGPSGLLVGGDFTEVANPTGVAGVFDTIDATHVAIFSNPVAVDPGPGQVGGRGNFACTVVTNNGNANITFTGDAGNSIVLRRDGGFEATVTGQTFAFVSGGAGSTYQVRIRGDQYNNPFQDIDCSGGGGTPTPTPTPTPPDNGGGNFVCTVETRNGNDNIRISGDRGISEQLRRNGNFEQTVTGETFVFIRDGNASNYSVRVRGQGFNGTEEIACSGGGGGGTPTPTPTPTPPDNGGGNFVCTVETRNGNDNIRISGDRGTSEQLRRNGNFEQTVTGETFVFIRDGNASNYVVRVRGQGFNGTEDFACTIR